MIDLTGHWVGWAALALFTAAYALVIAEDFTGLRKSKPVVMAAGLIWGLIAVVLTGQGRSAEVENAVRHVFLDYAELLLFLLVAMTYVNALEERRVFEALRIRLASAGLGYRGLFWATGGLAFILSPVADNLTTALVMGTVVMAVGRDEPRFITPACVNIVVAANAGGAFSPFGDITTLMVWQKGVVPFGDFFRLFPPALVNFALPAVIMHWAIPRGGPPLHSECAEMRPGAKRIMALFVATIATAVLGHTMLHLPPVIGMMTGLGYLLLLAYGLKRSHPFDVFHRIANVEWDTLLFFYGVMMCVGGLGLLGYLGLLSVTLYGGIGPTGANVLIGVLSAILDNIPLMFAVLTMQPDMSLGQWLLITLTTGVGGSLLSIGSAAGVALMGQARASYTFSSHLRWTPAVAAGYAAAIATHWGMNRALF